MGRDYKGNDHPPLAGDPAQGLCLMPGLTSLGSGHVVLRNLYTKDPWL